MVKKERFNDILYSYTITLRDNSAQGDKGSYLVFCIDPRALPGVTSEHRARYKL